MKETLFKRTILVISLRNGSTLKLWSQKKRIFFRNKHHLVFFQIVLIPVSLWVFYNDLISPKF